MSEKGIIKGIKIQLAGKTIKLTIEEAEELKEALNKLMGATKIEYVPYHPYPRPLYWQYENPWKLCYGGSVTYTSGNACTANISLASSTT